MRLPPAPAALALLAALALAGCLEPADQPAATADPGGAGDPARTGRSGARGGTEPSEDLEEARLLSQPLDLVGQDSASFTVAMPPNASFAYVRHAPEVQTLSTGFSVDLTGCGSGGFDSVNGGNVARSFALCDEAEPGAQTLTVHNDQGVVDGTIELWASFPTDEASASAN